MGFHGNWAPGYSISMQTSLPSWLQVLSLKSDAHVETLEEQFLEMLTEGYSEYLKAAGQRACTYACVCICLPISLKVFGPAAFTNRLV